MTRVAKLVVAASIAGAALIGSAAGIATSEAGGKTGPTDWGKGHGLGKCELNLSGEQKRQMKSVLSAVKDDARAAMESSFQARAAMRDAIQSGADERTVRKLAETAGDVEVELAVIRARFWAKALPILTGEQKEKLAACREEAEQGIRGWFDAFSNRALEPEALEE